MQYAEPTKGVEGHLDRPEEDADDALVAAHACARLAA
jgi:hypothetical protein